MLKEQRRRRKVRQKFKENDRDKDGMLTSCQLFTALCGVAADGLYHFGGTWELSQKYKGRTPRFDEFERICKEEHNGSEWLESSDSD